MDFKIYQSKLNTKVELKPDKISLSSQVKCSNSSLNTKPSNILNVSDPETNLEKIMVNPKVKSSDFCLNTNNANNLKVSKHNADLVKPNLISENQSSDSSPNENLPNILKVNSNAKVATSRTTRLETLMLDVFNEHTGKSEKVRAFLDGGSQMTVMSTDCAARCGLKLGDPETMMLSTFGQKVSKEKNYFTEDLVRLFLFLSRLRENKTKSCKFIILY